MTKKEIKKVEEIIKIKAPLEEIAEILTKIDMDIIIPFIKWDMFRRRIEKYKENRKEEKECIK